MRWRSPPRPSRELRWSPARSRRSVPFGFLAGDEVYGRSSKLRAACEKNGKGYVLAVPLNFKLTLPSRRRMAVASLARLVPARCWETRSCGPGCKGHRDYAWAWAATASPLHHVLIRRSIPDPSELAYFYCHVPAGGRCPCQSLIMVAGKRWPVEECHQQGKGQAPRPRSASGPAVALLPPAHRAVDVRPGAARHRRRPSAATRPVSTGCGRRASQAAPAAQPARWADTGILPASADETPPSPTPAWSRSASPKPGCLLRLATTPMTAAASQLRTTPGPDGGANTRHAPATTTTQARLREVPA